MRRQPIDHSDPDAPLADIQIDRRGGHAVCAGRRLTLRAKAWDTLLYLAARPGEVVSVDDLRRAVWRDVYVARKTVHNVVAELRAALAAGGGPAPIDTLKRRGYRLRARISHLAAPAEAAGDPRGPTLLVRPAYGARLDDVWDEALAHGTRVVLLVGEPGAGKSTLLRWLVDAMHDLGPTVGDPAGAAVALGCCADHGDGAEPLGPLLMAAAALFSERPGAPALLRRLAPTWLLQFPGLVEPHEVDTLQRLCAGSSTARRQREGVAFLEALAAQSPLLLAIEDLHWADADTLDLLAALARSARRVPLCVVGTLRRYPGALPDEQAARIEALRRDATEIEVTPFTLEEIAAYLRLRLDSAQVPADLAPWLLERTAGNPLMLQSACRQLIAEQHLTRDANGWHLAASVALHPPRLAADVGRAVAGAIDGLPPELLRVVEGASLLGESFGAAALAEILAEPQPAMERALSALVGEEILRRAGDDRYAFAHPVHRQVVRHGVPTERRLELHRAVATHLMDRPITPLEPFEPLRIAEHLAAAADWSRASEYFERAAHAATWRVDYAGAARHLEQALACIARLPATAASELREAHGRLLLGNLAGIQLSVQAPLALDNFVAAASIFDRHGERLEAFRARLGITFTTVLRGRCDDAQHAAARLLLDAEATPPLPGVAAAACAYAGLATLLRGEVDRACALLTRSQREPVADDLPRLLDLRPFSGFALATALAVRGDLPAARAMQADARAACRSDVLPASQPLYLLQDAAVASLVGDVAIVEQRVAEAAALCDSYAIFSLAPIGEFLRHWAAARRRPTDAAFAGMAAALDAHGRSGSRWLRPLLGSQLAAAYLDAGRLEAARDMVDQSASWIGWGGELLAQAEVHRVRAGCLAAAAGGAPPARRDGLRQAAVEELQRAVAVAAAQGSGLFAERARAQLEALGEPAHSQNSPARTRRDIRAS